MAPRDYVFWFFALFGALLVWRINHGGAELLNEKIGANRRSSLTLFAVAILVIVYAEATLIMAKQSHSEDLLGTIIHVQYGRGSDTIILDTASGQEKIPWPSGYPPLRDHAGDRASLRILHFTRRVQELRFLTGSNAGWQFINPVQEEPFQSGPVVIAAALAIFAIILWFKQNPLRMAPQAIVDRIGPAGES
jgi:hypothetical protein